MFFDLSRKHLDMLVYKLSTVIKSFPFMYLSAVFSFSK